jgi:hypothetical protein
MKQLNWSKMIAVGALFFVGVFAGISGCSSDDDENATPSNRGGSGGEDEKGGSSSKGGSTSSGGTTATGGTSSNSTAAAGATNLGGSSASGGSTSTSTSTSTCTPDTTKNCYSCAPQTSEQFLNACNAQGERPACTPYDNGKLTKLVDGKVPPLP